jgi:hypothetical protein
MKLALKMRRRGFKLAFGGPHVVFDDVQDPCFNGLTPRSDFTSLDSAFPSSAEMDFWRETSLVKASLANTSGSRDTERLNLAWRFIVLFVFAEFEK